MNHKSRVAILRTAADESIRLIDEGKSKPAVIRARLYSAMERTVAPAQMSPEQKAEKRAAKRFDKSRDKLLAWFRRDGVVKGAEVVHMGSGKEAKVLCDPSISAGGPVFEVKWRNGETAIANPLEFRPDFSIVAKAAVAAKTPKQKSKRAA